MYFKSSRKWQTRSNKRLKTAYLKSKRKPLFCTWFFDRAPVGSWWNWPTSAGSTHELITWSGKSYRSLSLPSLSGDLVLFGFGCVFGFICTRADGIWFIECLVIMIISSDRITSTWNTSSFCRSPVSESSSDATMLLGPVPCSTFAQTAQVPVLEERYAQRSCSRSHILRKSYIPEVKLTEDLWILAVVVMMRFPFKSCLLMVVVTTIPLFRCQTS